MDAGREANRIFTMKNEVTERKALGNTEEIQARPRRRRGNRDAVGPRRAQTGARRMQRTLGGVCLEKLQKQPQPVRIVDRALDKYAISFAKYDLHIHGQARRRPARDQQVDQAESGGGFLRVSLFEQRPAPATLET